MRQTYLRRDPSTCRIATPGANVATLKVRTGAKNLASYETAGRSAERLAAQEPMVRKTYGTATLATSVAALQAPTCVVAIKKGARRAASALRILWGSG